MSTRIHFEGQEYASIEQMSPDIRKAYEKSQAAAKLKAKLNADAAVARVPTGQASHPWDSKAGSGGMAVPAGFENITELGPAEQVYLVKFSGLIGLIVFLIIGLGFLLPGLYIFVASISITKTTDSSTITPSSWMVGVIFMLIGGVLIWLIARSLWPLRLRIHAVVVYHNGFAFRQRGSVRLWPWQEIATIFSNETFHMSSEGGATWTDRVYTLWNKDGKQIVLTRDEIENVGHLIDTIKQRTLPVLLPPLQQAYQTDQPVTFGPVTISREGGIDMGGKHFAWNDVLKVEVKDGKLLVIMKQGHVLGGQHSVRASTIPNIEALCQLIGLDPWTIDLTHV